MNLSFKDNQSLFTQLTIFSCTKSAIVQSFTRSDEKHLTCNITNTHTHIHEHL